jgi:hypothetical protein
VVDVEDLTKFQGIIGQSLSNPMAKMSSDGVVPKQYVLTHLLLNYYTI